jgi:hypothetical protein
MYELKTRGVLAKFSVFRFVAAAGNAHDFDSHFCPRLGVVLASVR